jgi:hypothetical protein
LTSEQLEAARAERMRQNGHGALTLEDACTWLEETGLCLFLPKRQFSNALAPSFVEAVAGQHNSTPDQKQIAVAEELLVRLEEKGVAVRLNLTATPGEQPDYVVAAWVLPYVYALRGDRDWRRTPQLTGSRAVSPLAIQLYKRLESNGEATVAELKQALGQGLTEMGVIRAITELWQQLRIIPIVSAPGKAAKWQLLRIRFQKAIAEGASTSQVTAISVLASIFLQAVIAASMEEVEVFLSPLTARPGRHPPGAHAHPRPRSALLRCGHPAGVRAHPHHLCQHARLDVLVPAPRGRSLAGSRSGSPCAFQACSLRARSLQ